MAKARQWSLLTAVAVVAVLAAGWFLVISPKHAEAGRLRADATAASGVNDTLRAQITALSAQARKLPQQRARLAVLAAKIPDNPALPTLIRTLRDAADRAGVDFVSVQPGTPAAFTPGAVPGAAAGPAAPAVPGAAAGGTAVAGAGQLLAIPVTVQVSGGFYQLEQFLTNLEDMPRSFLVGQLSVTPTSGGSPSGLPAGVPAAGVSGGTSTGALTANITGRIFMATAQPAVAAQAPVAPSAIAR